MQLVLVLAMAAAPSGVFMDKSRLRSLKIFLFSSISDFGERLCELYFLAQLPLLDAPPCEYPLLDCPIADSDITLSTISRLVLNISCFISISSRCSLASALFTAMPGLNTLKILLKIPINFSYPRGITLTERLLAVPLFSSDAISLSSSLIFAWTCKRLVRVTWFEPIENDWLVSIFSSAL